MIAAGAVVTDDVPPYALMIGVPARRVADLCRCGIKLDGDYRATICQDCGESPEMRCHFAEMEAINL
jgi:UDP-2-acetamido-3-amino-2,3-dideoxy-glucuronate N-acetyltransferase